MALSRQKVSDSIFDSSVQPYMRMVSGASVYVYEVGTTTPVDVYAAQSGGSPLSQPRSTDSTGSFEFWTLPGPIDIVTTGSGLSTVRRTIMVAADPDELVQVDTAALSLMDLVSNQTAAGNKTFSGNVTVNGTLSTTSSEFTAPTLNGWIDNGNYVHDVRHADYAGGAEADAALFTSSPSDGSVGWVGTDNTAAIQAAIDEAASSRSKTVAGSGSMLCGPLDLTERHGLRMKGADAWNLYPNASVNGKHFLDISGAGGIQFEDIGIGSYVQATGITPKSIIFLGQTAASSGNAHQWAKSSFIGRCSVAVIYNYGHASSNVRRCVFQGYNTGVPVMYWSVSNAASQTSDYVTVATGDQSAVEWTFEACEWHEAGAEREQWYLQDANYLSSTGWVWELEGSADIRLIGGNMGANGARYIRALNSAGGIKTTNLMILGTSHYAQDPAGDTVPYVLEVAAGSEIIGLVMLANRVDYTSSLLRLGSASVVTDALIRSYKRYGGGSSLVTMASGNGTLAFADIDCDTQAVNVGAGGTIDGDLRRHGTITASNNRAFSQDVNGRILVGGGFHAISSNASVSAGTSVAATTTVTGGTGVTATTGDVSATAGAIKGRKVKSTGTAITTSDFASAHTNWGSGAANTSASGTNLEGEITITSGSSGMAANPLITLTWKDSGFATAAYRPKLDLIATSDTTIANAPLCLITARATGSIQWEVRFTPAASKTYTFAWHVLGD